MDIYNITIKKTLVEGREKLVLYREGKQISDMEITNEEIEFLEEVLQQYSRVTSQYIHSTEFNFKNKEEAMAVGFILKDKGIHCEIKRNVVMVDGIRNSKMARLHIDEYVKWKDGLSE